MGLGQILSPMSGNLPKLSNRARHERKAYVKT